MTQINTAKNSPASNLHAGSTSWARWYRQWFFIPFLHNRWLTKQACQELTQAIKQAELGHRGEVFLVIENTLPLSSAYYQDCRERAIDLFGQYRVWDTEENTGVLVYMNVRERKLEIVADRGINKQVMPEMWQAMCDKAIAGIQQNKPIDSLKELLHDISDLLKQYYQLGKDPSGNELPDNVVYIK